MIKRTICLFLMLSLTLSVFSACGKTVSPSSSESLSVIQAETESAASMAEPAFAESGETTEPEPIEDSSESEFSSSAAEAEPIEVSYPLTEEPVELHMWTEAPSLGPLNMLGGDYGISNMADYDTVRYVNDLTNVHMSFEAANMMNASTLFNLHIASGDYADLLSFVDVFYTGGVAGAFNEGVIVGIGDYLADCAPHYSAILADDRDLAQATTTSDGDILQINSLFLKKYIASGTVIRQDWLDRVGMDVPETVEDLHEALLAFHSEIGCTNPFFMNSTCNQLLPSYDLVQYSSIDGSDLGIFQVEGTVYSTFIHERYRQWLQTMHQWYSEGLIDPDFISVPNSIFGGHDEELLAQDNLGVWWGNVNAFSNYSAMCPDENFAIASSYIAGTEEGVDHTTSLSRLYCFGTNVVGVCVSSACRDIECALGWLDFWYSDEGTQLANYGEEGIVYNMIDGEVQYTDLITNNEYGVDPTVALKLYAIAGGPFGVQMDEATFPFFEQAQVDALQTWTAACDGANTYPSAPMNAEETDLLTASVGDVMTHIATTVPQFIIGERDIETEWDTYLAEVDSMGFQDCLDAYQSALDRYLAE